MFSARVPLVRALEHCNINDTEIESSRGAVEGKERAYRAIYRPSFHRSRRERERGTMAFGLSEISTFEGVSNRASRQESFVICFFVASSRAVEFVYTDDTEIDAASRLYEIM